MPDGPSKTKLTVALVRGRLTIVQEAHTAVPGETRTRLDGLRGRRDVNEDEVRDWLKERTGEAPRAGDVRAETRRRRTKQQQDLKKRLKERSKREGLL